MIQQKTNGSSQNHKTKKEKEVYLVIENSLEERVKELRRRMAQKAQQNRLRGNSAA